MDVSIFTAIREIDGAFTVKRQKLDIKKPAEAGFFRFAMKSRFY